MQDSFRYWIQHLDNFIFLFAGGNEFYEIKDFDWSNYLINLRTIRISYLDEESRRILMTKPTPDYDLKYENEELLNDFIDLLGGQPYLIQAIMFDLTNLLNRDNNRKIAGKSDIEQAIKKCFTTTEAYFYHFWQNELNEEMRKQLINLAVKKELTNINTIRLLLKKEFIKKEEDGYQFSVPLVRQWIETRQI